ncbi:MAG: VCBS domain-containing protein, partial [Planctomycetota bacterium]
DATAAWSGDAIGTYGGLVIDPVTGVWTYTLDDTATVVEELDEGDAVTEIFTATVTDDNGASTTETITITVTGTNDEPVIAGPDNGTVAEAGHLDDGTAVAGTPTANGTMVSNDIDDSATATWSGDATSTYGALTIDATGNWTYTLDNTAAEPLDEGDVVSETFTVTVTDDQGAADTETITVTING